MIHLAGLEFTQLSYEQFSILVSWAENEGWNPGMGDAAVFYATDPNGFYGYFHQGELIAGGSIVSYDGAFGFMGFFIVKEPYRATGIGRQLWHTRRNTLLARLGNGASIGMDGVVPMQPFYQKGGFEIAFKDERHERLGTSLVIDSTVSAIEAEDFLLLLPYDRACFGCDRQRFLQAWVYQPHAKAFKRMEAGQLKGFAVIRKAVKGYRIGPLFASDPTTAEELYKACLNAAPGEPVFIDIPLANPHAITLTQQYGTTCVFECARMYYGPAPTLPIDNIYGLSSLELG